MLKTLMAAAAAMTLAGAAHASVTFTSVAFDPSIPPAGMSLVDTFDAPVAAGYTFTGGTITSGSTVGVSQAPFGDTTNYDYVVGGSSATFTANGTGLSALSVYIGSLDTYNMVSFSGPSGVVGAFTGAQLAAGLATGDTTGAADNRLFTFNFNGTPVTSATFSSSLNSLEFDNIAVSALPEPASWALMIVGVGMVGAAMRVAKRNAGTSSVAA